MYTLLLIVQIVLALGIIVLILLQHGKGADAGAAFGSGASATVFGARGAGNFMSRATAILATLFFANSLLLSTPLIIGDRKAPGSVTERVQAPAQPPAETQEAPAAPSDLPDMPAAPAAPAGSDLP
jgi:preprotein translocase subunit SecG